MSLMGAPPSAWAAARGKECASCGSNFQPQRMGQKVCSPVCARRKVEADKKAEKAQTKARKEAIKTIPDLKREAQKEFNAYIRYRDRHQPCISCGAPPPDMAGFHAGRDAGHYRSVGSAAHLRFDERNCHAQCVRCNQWGAGKAVDYRLGLIPRIGIEAVEALESDNDPVKWDRDTLRQIKVTYRAKTRDLKKANS